VPSLIAGIAVFSVRKWSYPVFLVSMLWITFQMLRTFSPHLHITELIFTIILPILFNFLYVSYILLPKVRAAYYDPGLRWWETKPRYVFSTAIKFTIDGEVIDGKMTNISEGGLFALLANPIEPNSLVN
jgi:hypothetical protein